MTKPALRSRHDAQNDRGQLNGAGRVALDGLICVGGTVCTTNPAAGRGMTTSLLQARRLISLLEQHA